MFAVDGSLVLDGGVEGPDARRVAPETAPLPCKTSEQDLGIVAPVVDDLEEDDIWWMSNME